MYAYLKSNHQVIQKITELSNQNSGGNLRKWTGLLNNKRVYIKTSSSERGKTWYECEAECVSCRVANLLGISQVVFYYLDTLVLDKREYKVCYSFDFVGNGEYLSYNTLIPSASRAMGVQKYNLVTGFYPNLRSRIDTILLFDSIIGNNDRHLRNIGVLKIGNSYCIPLFDCGNSLFYNKSQQFIKTMLKSNLDYLPCKPFYSSFNKQLTLCNLKNIFLNRVYKEDVYKIVNRYYSGERAKLLCKFLVLRLRRFNLLWN